MTTRPPLCALDFETTGLGHGRRAWEYAAIRRDYADNGGFTETTHHGFVSIDIRHADPFALKVGGFWDRHPSGRKMSGKTAIPGPPAESRHDAARDLMRVTFGAHIVGINPSFDTETLEPWLRTEGYQAGWDYHLIDVAAMAYGWLAARGAEVDLPWKSDALAWSCGVEPPPDHERHTALGDARFALRWYDALTATATAGQVSA